MLFNGAFVFIFKEEFKKNMINLSGLTGTYTIFSISGNWTN